MHRDDNETSNFTDVSFIELGEIWCCFYQIGPKLGYVCIGDTVEGWEMGTKVSLKAGSAGWEDERQERGAFQVEEMP